VLILQPRQLTVLATSGCTATCSHCSMRSAPGRREQLTFEQIRDAIDALHAESPLRVIIFAGGEPTLLGEALLDAIAHADTAGILTRLVTNAYWATSPARARTRLRAFREAGLRELNLSADDQHLPFVPFERVEYAWRASKGLGFQAVIIANCSGPRSHITPEYVEHRLGERLGRRFDEDGSPLPLATPAADGTVYGLSNAYLQRLGRGANIPDDELNFPDSLESLNTPCPWAVRSAALSPANHLVACCGIEAEGNPVLDFGSAVESSFGELVARADNSILINAIALLGPVYVKRFVEERVPDIPWRERYASVCEVCEHVVSRPEVLEAVRDHSAELALQLLPIRDALEATAPTEHASFHAPDLTGVPSD
jgi:hypothetical protein